MRSLFRIFAFALPIVCVLFVFAQQTSAQQSATQQSSNPREVRITMQELPMQSAATLAPTLRSNEEAGLFIITAKKRVSAETEKKFLKEHPEAAFILPANAQERIKAGLPLQVIKIHPEDIPATSTP